MKLDDKEARLVGVQIKKTVDEYYPVGSESFWNRVDALRRRVEEETQETVMPMLWNGEGRGPSGTT